MTRTFLALCALVLLAGSPTRSEAQTVKLKLAEPLRSQFYVPMYVALGKGFVKEEGLEIELTTAQGSDRAGALMLSGQADFALAGPEVPIYIYNGESADKPLIFCALTGTDGYFLVSKQKIENFSWTMMNGKKILGQRPGSTPQLYLDYLLRARGVDPATVNALITNIGPAARDGAWISGVADFGIFTEPGLTKLEKAGQAHVLASIGKEIGRADYTVFTAKKSWLEKNPELAQKWTNAIARAQEWMRTANSRDIAEVITPFFPGLSIDDHVAVVERFRNSGAPIWAETTDVDRDGLRRAQEMMVAGGVLTADKVLPYETIVTSEFSRKAQQRVSGK